MKFPPRSLFGFIAIVNGYHGKLPEDWQYGQVRTLPKQQEAFLDAYYDLEPGYQAAFASAFFDNASKGFAKSYKIAVRAVAVEKEADRVLSALLKRNGATLKTVGGAIYSISLSVIRHKSYWDSGAWMRVKFQHDPVTIKAEIEKLSDAKVATGRLRALLARFVSGTLGNGVSYGNPDGDDVGRYNVRLFVGRRYQRMTDELVRALNTSLRTGTDIRIVHLIGDKDR